MRVFIAVLVLIFSLQSWTKADDIRDFEIEGMSIGDSLLDFFIEEEINLAQKVYYPKSKKYYAFGFFQQDFYNTYEHVQFIFMANDTKYIIHSISGKLFYENQFDECNKKKDVIADEISNNLNIKRQVDNGDILKGDKTGKSISNSISFFFDNGDQIMIDCSDWSDASSYADNLSVTLRPNYINDWLLYEAY